MFAFNEFPTQSFLRKKFNNFLMPQRDSFEVVEAFVCRDRNENYISTSHFVSFERAVDDLENPSPVHLNQKKFLDQSDYFTKRFIDIVEKEIEDFLTDGSIENIDLRGRKEKSFTAWISLLNGRGTLEIDESFLRKSYYLTELKVTGLTLVSDNDVKGLQISVDEEGVRLYKIINGTVSIAFNWKTIDKNCRIAATIADDGEIIFNEMCGDVTCEDMEDNRFFRVSIAKAGKRELTLLDLYDKARIVYECED
ncbi:uncharacterized protein TNCT_350951 [Trichonephila clavata]|uniref:Uncharacterized protein n=1 Tax=Trichonephila clavata TaxID=2740835 RepID=A0A8X6I401_TRICU|nr:uncharacterized protein TNCT_350951 [Trichonephila clavata]